MSRYGKHIRIAFIVAPALFVASCLEAQQKPFDTIQVNVVTHYKPAIHDVVKLDNNPSGADSVHISRKVKYDFLNTQYPTIYTPPQISALQIKGEPQEKLFHSLLEAGVGNYNTLYGEYFFNSLRSHDWDYGFHLNHLSSDYTLNSVTNTYAFNNIDAYGEGFFSQHTLKAQAGFQNHEVHDYGLPLTVYDNLIDRASPGNPFTPDLGKERFDLVDGSLDYASTYKDSSLIGHDIKLKYYSLNDIYHATENSGGADMKFFTYFNQQRIDLKVDVNTFNENNPLGSSSNWDGLFNPYFSTYETHWDAHLGANVYYNSIGKKINVYPDLLARYHIAQDVVMLYAGIDGKEIFNSYKSLSDVNPFVQDTMRLNYTYTKYHVYGGIAGSITHQLTYNISVSQSMENNMPLFVTDTMEFLRNRFTVVYDNIKISNVHADLDYKWKNTWDIILGGDYYIYTPTNQLEAWYNPALKLSATGRYTIQRKYTLKAEFFVVGSQYAPTVDHVEPIVPGPTTIVAAKELAGYPDLNLGIDYKYNKVFTAFLNLNNIANVQYYAWDNYAMEKFNVLIGIRLGF